MRWPSIQVNSYCTLLVNPTGWEGATIPVLVEIFQSIMEEFNSLVEVTPQRPIVIQPDPGLGCPRCCKDGTIYLSARQDYWSKYVYQFAHEYCHYLIDGPLDGELETTFWFEESICELASMVMLNKVTDRWLSWTQAIIPNNPLTARDQALLRLKGFAPNNIPYLIDLLKENPRIDVPLSEWIDNNKAVLSEPTYHRDMYNQIATVLYDLFTKYPDLWKVIPFLHRPTKEDYADFKTFITIEIRSRINLEIEHFSVFERYLTGNNESTKGDTVGGQTLS